MTIERTHHGYEAVTALPGECKRFSPVTRSAAPDTPPQAQRCLGARGEIIIKRHDDRQRLVWWSVTQPETKLTHVVSDDDVSAIRADVLCTSGSELCEVKRLSPKQGIWRRLEQNDVGSTSGRQNTATRSAASLGSTGKAQPPTPGEGIPCHAPGTGVGGGPSHHRFVVFLIGRVTAQEFPRKTRPI